MGRIRIENESGEVQGTRFVDVVTGQEIRGLTKAVVTYEAKQPVRAELSLIGISHKSDAEAVFLVGDPVDGKLRRVKSIEFADGVRREFE